MHRDEGLIAAAEALGSLAALARALGISDEAVRDWSRIPVHRVLQVEDVTAVPRKTLRFDLYPADEELAEHADAIRRIDRQRGRRSQRLVETEIGRRLFLCRKLFKGPGSISQRAWSGWVRIEFGWSGKRADDLIGLYLNERDRKVCEAGNPAHRAAAEGLVKWVTRLPVLSVSVAEIAAVLPAKHKVDRDVDRVMRVLGEFRRARYEARAEKSKWLLHDHQ